MLYRSCLVRPTPSRSLKLTTTTGYWSPASRSKQLFHSLKILAWLPSNRLCGHGNGMARKRCYLTTSGKGRYAIRSIFSNWLVPPIWSEVLTKGRSCDPVGTDRKLSIRWKDDKIAVFAEFLLGVKAQQGIQDGKGTVTQTEHRSRLAGTAIDSPLVDAFSRLDICHRKLTLHQGKRHRSPPERRRYISCLHVPLTFLKAKEINSPNWRQRLLTVIHGNAILRLLRHEEGFHDGDVGGPFSFAAIFLLFQLNSETPDADDRGFRQ